MDGLDEAFDTLAAADVVAFGGVGFAGTLLPVTEAYYLVREAGPAVRPRLDRLLAAATPAGRVYAAELLTALDPEAGRAIWQRLADDETKIATFSGCVQDQTTLARYAGDRLGRPER